MNANSLFDADVTIDVGNIGTSIHTDIQIFALMLACILVWPWAMCIKTKMCMDMTTLENSAYTRHKRAIVW